MAVMYATYSLKMEGEVIKEGVVGVDSSESKFSIHEAIIEEIQTVCFIGTHGFQMPLVCSKDTG